MIKEVLLIGFGGFIGSVVRYYVSKLNVSLDLYSLPIGTLTVNILGSLLLGFLTGIVVKSPILTVEWRLFLMVGICGGFTTFSTFTSENLMLIHNGQFLSAALYTGLSLVFGFLAVFLGYASSNLL
ncbi:MAG: fluoride efflux transporter CrcB [Bacteroidales bacterium]|jgi:CrcB protein